MTRTMKLAATALLGCSIAVAATACGSENSASSTPSAATSVTAPASSSIPVVGGPKPQTTATEHHTRAEATTPAGPSCGATNGPDGALQIHVVAGDLPCETAKTIAKEYGPLIATGAPQTVSGWACAPSKITGELSRCTKGSQAFALTP